MIDIKAEDIKLVETASIVENPKNNNRHSIEQLERLEKIIKYQGFRNPLVVSNRTGFLIAGHGRLEVAKKLGMEKVPVIYQDFKNEAQEYAHLTADNEIARWAELDKQAVYMDIAELDLEIDLLGIENFELGDVGEIDLPDLNSGEKSELEQITFTLHTSQMDTVKEAMKEVKAKYPDAVPSEFNENMNGNAINYICELFLTNEC